MINYYSTWVIKDNKTGLFYSDGVDSWVSNPFLAKLFEFSYYAQGYVSSFREFKRKDISVAKIVGHEAEIIRREDSK